MEALPEYDQQANGKLLLELFQSHNAYGVGNITNFFAVRTNWRCPSCHRSKQEIARLDKNGSLLCRIVEHHDHYVHLVEDKIPSPRYSEGDAAAVRAVQDSFRRFAPTLICEDCNVAEGAAKSLVGAVNEFTFTPYEIMQFVEVTPNQPHSICHERCYPVYEVAHQSVKQMTVHFRGVIAGMRDGKEGEFIPIGDAAVRVLRQAFAAKKKNDA